tara:strand:+ start:1358 stop:2230 length:873 start_codon:yes stop_codon:yes gene_type:complete
LVTNNELKQFSIALVKEAGKYVLNSFEGEFEVSFKDRKNNLVTEIDKKSQLIIEKIIISKFPEHKIIGEEDQKDKKIEDISEYVWVIDPIDGTTNFVNGIPNFSISVAILKNCEPIAGAIWIPWPNEKRYLIFSTAKGEGSWANNVRLNLSGSDPNSLDSGGISSYSSLSPIVGNKDRNIIPSKEILRGEKRVMGSVAYEMAMISKGAIKFALLGPAYIWDFGAGLLMIKEANGSVIALDSNYSPTGEFRSFLSGFEFNKKTLSNMRNWEGQFLAGSQNIINLADSKKFV